MILRALPDGLLLIPQSAHALAAFALARHWGNRQCLAPSPLNEVLAAVLLHDAGWDLAEREPALTPAGEVASFACWPEGPAREALWWDSFRLALSRGRFVAWLVGRHLLHLARTYSPRAHLDFERALQAKLEELEASLKQEASFRQLFATGRAEADVAILRLCDALALRLCQGTGQPHTLPAAPFKDGARDLKLLPAGEDTHRLHPWPFIGRRLALWVEGRLLTEPLPKSAEELFAVYRRAPFRRLRMELCRLGSAPP